MCISTPRVSLWHKCSCSKFKGPRCVIHLFLHEAYPYMKIKHSLMKPSLETFAKLYPSSVGATVAGVSLDMVFNAWSQSFRVLLWHYRKVTFVDDAWRKCTAKFKGDRKSLDLVVELLDQIIPMPDGEEIDDDDDEPPLLPKPSSTRPQPSSASSSSSRSTPSSSPQMPALTSTPPSSLQQPELLQMPAMTSTQPELLQMPAMTSTPPSSLQQPELLQMVPVERSSALSSSLCPAWSPDAPSAPFWQVIS